MTLVATIQAPSGAVLEFLVLFGVILFGPLVVSRFGLPGLIGLLLGGFAIGPHGLDLIKAGDQTVPELGQLGLLYLMFVAGLELDLHMLQKQRRAAVMLGLVAFGIPLSAGLVIGWALGWSVASTVLLGALFSSHTLIVYPTLRDAGFAGNRAVASAVGATVLTDTLALVVLAVVAGTQTASARIGVVLVVIALGFVVLIGVGVLVLPRVVDAALRRWAGDRVARYLVVVVALLGMAALAEIFGIEPIIGAFFAGLALNRLVPNNSQSMDRVEFFGSAVFIPVFVVSIGLLLEPSVMFQANTLELAGLICLGALGGKAIACWFTGAVLGFDRPERAAMYVLTAPQAAATLAVTLIGFELGLFDTEVVNAVLVLILVSITLAAVLTQRVITWMPRSAPLHRAIGEKVLVAAMSPGPSDTAMRAATRLARPDGGHGEIVVARLDGEARPEPSALRALEEHVFGHGFDGRLTTMVGPLSETVPRAVCESEPSVVVVDDAEFDTLVPGVPVVVVRLTPSGDETFRVVGPIGDDEGVEITRRIREERPTRRLRRRRRGGGPPANGVTRETTGSTTRR